MRKSVTAGIGMTHLSRVGAPDDDMRVERVETSRQNGALGGQLVLWPVLHCQ